MKFKAYVLLVGWNLPGSCREIWSFSCCGKQCIIYKKKKKKIERYNYHIIQHFHIRVCTEKNSKQVYNAILNDPIVKTFGPTTSIYCSTFNIKVGINFPKYRGFHEHRLRCLVLIVTLTPASRVTWEERLRLACGHVCGELHCLADVARYRLLVVLGPGLCKQEEPAEH